MVSKVLRAGILEIPPKLGSGDKQIEKKPPTLAAFDT